MWITTMMMMMNGQRILTKGRIARGVFQPQIKIHPITYHQLHLDDFA